MDVPFHNWLLVDSTLKVFWLDKRFGEVNSFTFLVLGKGLFEGSNPVLEDELFNLSKKEKVFVQVKLLAGVRSYFICYRI